jgi:predicted ATPase
MFVPDVVLNMKDRGEFREIVSVFIGFEESDGYAESVKQVIKNTHAYGGYFNKIDFGDKGGVMLVIFGAPTGREKLYSRAADFALSLKQTRDFKFRIGISTGIAFCGIVGSDLRKEYTALGNVVNLSARLMMKAEPYQILTGPQIKSKLPAQYEFENKGLTEFKGFSDKIEIFSLLNKTDSKQQLSYSGSFVGRKKEAEELRKLIQPIYEEKFAGIVYIDGPAGIGKSRFIDNFVKNLDDCTSFYLPCDEVLRNSFNPFECFFRIYFGQSEALSKEDKMAIFIKKYTQIVSQTQNEEIKSELIRTESVIGALIGLEWENSLYAQLDAKGKYENTLYAVKNFFLAQSLTKPVILVLEDGHWIDSDSLALVKTLIRNVEKYPFVILALCRPNDDGSVFDLFDPDILEFPLNRLNIESFNKEMMNELLKDRFSSETIPGKTSDLIWEKSTGNPFFVEQLVLYLTENNLLDGSMNLVSEAKSIPSGISQIIIARIDRLTVRTKHAVKTASVLGMEFSLRVLEKMLGKNVNEDHSFLEAGRSEQIWEEISELKYIFKHALIREAVYEIQLKSSLRVLHDLAGQIIEELYSESLQEHHEELADHFFKGENRDKAIVYLEKAADTAKAGYRNEKALELYNKLIALLELNGLENDMPGILIKKGSVCELKGLWNEAGKSYKSAAEIATRSNDYKFLAESSIKHAVTLSRSGLHNEAIAEINEILYADKPQSDTDLKNMCLNNLGIVYMNIGKYSEALDCFQKCLNSANQDESAKSKYLTNEGIIYYYRGEYERSLKCYREALDLKISCGDKRGSALVMGNIGLVYIGQNRNSEALEITLKCLNTCREIGDRNGIAIATGSLGMIYEETNKTGQALECYNTYLEMSKETGDLSGESRAECNIGNIHLGNSDYDTALKHYFVSLELHKRNGDRSGEARILSNIALAFKNKKQFLKAEEYYSLAADIHKKTGEKSALFKMILKILNIPEINIGTKLIERLSEAEKLAVELKRDDLLSELANIRKKYE